MEAEARGYYDRAIAHTKPQVHEDPRYTWHRYHLVREMRRRGLTLRALGDPGSAASDSRRALGLCDKLPPSLWNLFETACCHAALAGLAGRAGSGVSSAEGEIEATRAMGWLHRAVAMGYRNSNEIRIESALDPIRSRPDFKDLMLDVAFPPIRLRSNAMTARHRHLKLRSGNDVVLLEEPTDGRDLLGGDS